MIDSNLVGFVEKDFCSVVKDLTSGNPKVASKDYLMEGRYPIIDQGSNFCSGYTDSKELLCNIELPCIIFGDHTRVLKYVDTPFALGADGVKVLKPIKGLSEKYLFYFLKNLDIPSAGYSRHFKFLKEKNIKYPLQLSEQKRIIAILDKADGIRQKREKAIKLVDDFLRATFLEMFGDPVENPKGWDVASLLEYGSFKNGMNFTKGESGSVLKCLGVGDFKSLATITCMDNIGEIELNTPPSADYLLNDGDIVFVRSNGNKALVGRCLTIYPGKEKVTFSGFCIRYRIENSATTPEYLNFLFRTPSMKQQMLSGGQGANIQNISQGTLSALRIPVPPLDKQITFTKLVDFHASIVKKQYDKMAESEKLFNALTGDFFTFNE